MLLWPGEKQSYKPNVKQSRNMICGELVATRPELNRNIFTFVFYTFIGRGGGGEIFTKVKSDIIGFRRM